MPENEFKQIKNNLSSTSFKVKYFDTKEYGMKNQYLLPLADLCRV